MRHVNDFPRETIEYPDMGIVMDDGCRLSARVWLPADAADDPVPAILEFLPYRKRDGTVARDELTHPWFAGHGYACLRVDMRGNGESEGLMSDEYTPQELADACAAIAWAAEQPWCDGKVGMMGISWGGFNALQVAAMRPDALKAVITICSTVDRYADDIHYKGGCLLVENFGWATTMLAYSSRPPDPELVGANKARDLWLARLEAMPWLLAPWLRHQHRDEYWKHGSVCEDYSAIEAAVLSIGGWHDGYRNTISHLVENLAAPVKGIVGPWNHKYPHFAAPGPAIGFLQEAKRWWDRWLKDVDTGVENDPAYRAWLMDSVAPKRWFEHRPGRWIAERDWPSQNTTQQRLCLRETKSGQGTLVKSPSARTGKAMSVKVDSPMDCGLMSGEYFPFAYGDELPGEQNEDDARSACFDGGVAPQALDIVGAPVVELTLSADKPNTQIAVRLCDLRHDGTSALITYGVLNLTHRDSHEFPQPMEPDKPFTIRLALDQIAYRIPAGHRLRLAVSTAYWPYIWPSPERASVRITAGSLELPVRPPASGDEWQFEDPEAAPAWRSEERRPASYERTIETDEETGERIVRILADSGEHRDLAHGLISGSSTREEWRIRPDDPLSARGRIETEKTGGRDGAMWRTHVVATMHCDATHFHSAARLICEQEGRTVLERDFSDSVERKLV